MEEKVLYNSTDEIVLCGILNKLNDNNKMVIMCHGLRGDKEEKGSFTLLAEKLAESGINSFRFDFRSQGESTGVDYEMCLSGEKDDLITTIEYLRKLGYSDFTVLGASFGAAVVSSLDFSKYPDISSLVFWYGLFDFLGANNVNLGKETYEIAKRDGYFTRIRNGKTARFGLKFFEELVTGEAPWKKLVNLNIPILFVHGTKDTIVPASLSEMVYRQCKNAEFKLIEGGWHTFDNLKSAQEEAAAETTLFIKKKRCNHIAGVTPLTI